MLFKFSEYLKLFPQIDNDLFYQLFFMSSVNCSFSRNIMVCLLFGDFLFQQRAVSSSSNFSISTLYCFFSFRFFINILYNTILLFCTTSTALIVESLSLTRKFLTCSDSLSQSRSVELVKLFCNTYDKNS